jgi:pyruvate-formate lyase-activating enzyme
MVCSKEIDLDEFKELCEMIAEHDAQIPLVLQPLTRPGGLYDVNEVPVSFLEELQTIALGILKDVRIIPRLHKILNVR